MNEPDLEEAAFKTENVTEHIPESGKLYQSMENYCLLKSGHAQSQGKYGSVTLNFSKLVLTLTALLLLTMAQPGFCGNHGVVV